MLVQDGRNLFIYVKRVERKKNNRLVIWAWRENVEEMHVKR